MAVRPGHHLQSRSGLREEELLGSLAKVQVFRDGVKHFRAKVIELRHDPIMHGNPSFEIGIDSCSFDLAVTQNRYRIGVHLE